MVTTYDMATALVLASDDAELTSSTSMPVRHPTALSTPCLALQSIYDLPAEEEKKIPADLATVDADSFIRSMR